MKDARLIFIGAAGSVLGYFIIREWLRHEQKETATRGHKEKNIITALLRGDQARRAA